jgi:hypothetical protein
VPFDPKKFLATIAAGRKVLAFPKKQTIFRHEELAEAVSRFAVQF